MSQCKELLAAFQRNEKLTMLDSLRKYHVLALSQRCTELRALGYPIKSEMVKVGKKRIALYWMEAS